MDGSGSPLLLAAAKPPDSFQWTLIGVLAVATVYVAVIRPFLRKKKDPLDRSPSQARLAQERSVERQMQNLLVELSEMARQISAQLDTRTAKLELLIREADEKIEKLRRAGVAPAQAEIKSQVMLDADVVEGAPPTIDPRHAEIYALADQGRRPLEIAQQLGRPSGEVELILALRQQATPT
jgi:hypothetical protein